MEINMILQLPKKNQQQLFSPETMSWYNSGLSFCWSYFLLKKQSLSCESEENQHFFQL